MTLPDPQADLPDLFDVLPQGISLGPGAKLLRGFASPSGDVLLAEVAAVVEAAPFRHMVTPGGWVMSVAMTNCGNIGWVTDESSGSSSLVRWSARMKSRSNWVKSWIST